MENHTHIVINIEQDDNIDEIINLLQKIKEKEGNLYCAEIQLNLFNKTKNELTKGENIKWALA